MVDTVFEEVVARVRQRQEKGSREYGQPMDRKDKPPSFWVDEAIDEALDLIVYLTRLKRDLQ